MSRAFVVDDGGINTPTGSLFDALSFSIDERRTTVVLGPSGTGKSALLGQLAGEPMPAGWSRAGVWRFRDTETRACPQLRIIHQAHRPSDAGVSLERERVLFDALESDASVLLLDEPTRGISERAMRRLSGVLAEQHGQRTFVIVTHDLAFAREVADDIRLFCAGRLEASGPAKAFFEDPPTALSRRFLQLGNCWPSARRPSLPSHFRWVIPNRLAGMGRPGLLGSVEEDLEAIAQNGVEVLISLTEVPVAPAALKGFGIEGRHLPIKDMGIPGTAQLTRTLAGIKRSIGNGTAVAVHCDAGLGRTGTVLAAFLIWQGHSAASAVEEVRKANPGYIQSQTQMRFLEMFGDDHA